MNYLNGTVKGKSTSISKNKIKESLSQISTVFVKKWVDYSSKYGLGYLLSDGTTGIYFNDNSKILVDHYNNKIDYVSKSDGRSSELMSFSMEEIPHNREISKKVTLMQYFRKYLNGANSYQTSSNTGFSEKKPNDPPFCYVKCWLKTYQVILFRLNNKIIQVNFSDKSQLVIYAEKELMVFTGANHSSKSFYHLGDDIPRGSEAYRKLEVVKGMLIKLNSKEEESKPSVDNEESNLMVDAF